MGIQLKPVPTSVLLLSARRRGTCRLCGGVITLLVEPEYPQEYDRVCGRTVANGSVTVNYGEEFCHTDCMIDRTQEVLA